MCRFYEYAYVLNLHEEGLTLFHSLTLLSKPISSVSSLQMPQLSSRPPWLPFHWQQWSISLEEKWTIGSQERKARRHGRKKRDRRGREEERCRSKRNLTCIRSSLRNLRHLFPCWSSIWRGKRRREKLGGWRSRSCGSRCTAGQLRLCVAWVVCLAHYQSKAVHVQNVSHLGFIWKWFSSRWRNGWSEVEFAINVLSGIMWKFALLRGRQIDRQTDRDVQTDILHLPVCEMFTCAFSILSRVFVISCVKWIVIFYSIPVRLKPWGWRRTKEEMVLNKTYILDVRWI